MSRPVEIVDLVDDEEDTATQLIRAGQRLAGNRRMVTTTPRTVTTTVTPVLDDPLLRDPHYYPSPIPEREYGQEWPQPVLENDPELAIALELSLEETTQTNVTGNTLCLQRAKQLVQQNTELSDLRHDWYLLNHSGYDDDIVYTKQWNKITNEYEDVKVSKLSVKGRDLVKTVLCYLCLSFPCNLVMCKNCQQPFCKNCLAKAIDSNSLCYRSERGHQSVDADHHLRQRMNDYYKLQCERKCSDTLMDYTDGDKHNTSKTLCPNIKCKYCDLYGHSADKAGRSLNKIVKEAKTIAEVIDKNEIMFEGQVSSEIIIREKRTQRISQTNFESFQNFPSVLKQLPARSNFISRGCLEDTIKFGAFIKEKYEQKINEAIDMKIESENSIKRQLNRERMAFNQEKMQLMSRIQELDTIVRNSRIPVQNRQHDPNRQPDRHSDKLQHVERQLEKCRKEKHKLKEENNKLRDEIKSLKRKQQEVKEPEKTFKLVANPTDVKIKSKERRMFLSFYSSPEAKRVPNSNVGDLSYKELMKEASQLFPAISEPEKYNFLDVKMRVRDWMETGKEKVKDHTNVIYTLNILPKEMLQKKSAIALTYKDLTVDYKPEEFND